VTLVARIDSSTQSCKLEVRDAVQSAAAVAGREVATVAQEWATVDRRTIEPSPTDDAAHVRNQYRDLLRRTHPEPGDRT
jgi:hypothetical protein